MFFNSLLTPEEIEQQGQQTDLDKLSQAFLLSPGSSHVQIYLFNNKLLWLTQRWSDSRGLIYTSHTQEMGGYTRRPIHLFILHFSCQAISFQLAIVFSRKKANLECKIKIRKSSGSFRVGIQGGDSPEGRMSPRSERWLYLFLDSDIFVGWSKHSWR